MTVTPLVWRENPDIDSEEDKENYWVAQNSCGGLYQRYLNYAYRPIYIQVTS